MLRDHCPQPVLGLAQPLEAAVGRQAGPAGQEVQEELEQQEALGVEEEAGQSRRWAEKEQHPAAEAEVAAGEEHQ